MTSINVVDQGKRAATCTGAKGGVGLGPCGMGGTCFTALRESTLSGVISSVASLLEMV